MKLELCERFKANFINPVFLLKEAIKGYNKFRGEKNNQNPNKS
jgi:hypothetical protein